MRYADKVSATLESPSWVDAPVLVLDPLRESQRIDDLRSLNLLDTEPEDRFDRITRLATEFFHVSTAYVAFIESDRQWYKSRVGLCPSQTSRGISFCQYTIAQDKPLVMPDTRLHPIGATHPFVVGKPFIRFYAGVPLAGPRGHKIGTFCIVDTEPRKFDEGDVAALVAFAALVEREINLGEIIQSQNELLSTRQKLLDVQKELDREFSDAAKYVQSMLPPPFQGEESIDWQFHPSARLGGDGLGYRRIDEDQIAFYVLDVTGHGLGSALLAVTALELLRNRNPASQISFGRPASVVERLNRTFQMKDHAGKFFSVWYGVYSRSKRTITYSNAGHPPALLLAHKDGTVQLAKTAPGASVLGIMPEIQCPEMTIEFPAGSELFLFTDGIYEVLDPLGGRGSYDEFLAAISKQIERGTPAWDAILNWLTRARDQRLIDDDVTLLRFATKS
jgi:sigma-B regulation protein RsbU (phosphoserine phosphatase)